MAGPFTEAEVITGWGTGRGDFAGANAPQMRIADPVVPVIAAPGWRTLWYPWELKAFTSGSVPQASADGRGNFWRFVAPTNAAYYTDVFPTQGCDSILVIGCFLLAAGTGNASLDIYGCTTQVVGSAAQTYIGGTGNVTPLAGGQWCACGVGPSGTVPARNLTWPYMRIGVTAPAASTVATVYVLGR